MPPFIQTFHQASIGVAGFLIVAALSYAYWWRRLRAVHGLLEVRARHAATFAAGLVVLAVALAGPLDWIGERRLLSGHIVAHLLIVSVAPALMLIAVPRPAWPGAVINLDPRRTAVICATGAVATIWLLHVPAVLDAGLQSPALNDLQHAPLLLAGIALAWPLVGPRPVAGLAAVAYLAIVELGVGVVGVWLTWFPEVAYDSYLQVPRLWDLSARTDQSLAGAIWLVVEEPFLAIEVAILFIRALDDHEPDDDDDS
ncbi:MAG: cytochrome c oxidase assembly protein [Thermoleophilia bacterium]